MIAAVQRRVFRTFAFRGSLAAYQPLLFFAFVAFLLFFRLGHRDLYSSHEARAAQNAQRMLDTGEWGLPILFDGQADLQKPPGYYWLAALAGWLNGGTLTEFETRLPAALAGLLTVLMVFGFLQREGRPTAAWIAAAALATAVHFTAIARTARIDVPLACAVTASLLLLYRYSLWAALPIAAGILLKGPIALALIGPTAFLWMLVKPADGRRWALPLACTLGVLLSLPWFLWVNHITQGEFYRVFIVHHHVERFAGTSPALASHPWWYYAPRFAVDFLPWTPALLFLCAWMYRGRRAELARRASEGCRIPSLARRANDVHYRFGLIWFAAMFVVLSTAHFKRADYLLPLYPGAAMALGCAAEAWLATRTARTVRFGKWTFAVIFGGALAGWQIMSFVVEPAEQAKEEKRAFATMIREQAPQPNEVLLFRTEPHLLAWHLGRPVLSRVEWHDLRDFCESPGDHFVVLPPEYVWYAQHHVRRKLVEVARLEDYTADKPPRPLVFLRTE